MEYLKSIYGSYILSGQHSVKGINGSETAALKKIKGGGRLPEGGSGEALRDRFCTRGGEYYPGGE